MTRNRLTLHVQASKLLLRLQFRRKQPDEEIQLSPVKLGKARKLQMEAQTQETAAAANSAPAELEPLLLKDIKKGYFPPSKLGAAAEILARLTLANISPIMNFNPEGSTLPDNFGISVIPLGKQVKGHEGLKRYAVVMAAIPDFAAVAQHENAAKFLGDLWTKFCGNRITQALRPKEDGTTDSVMPFSLESFLEVRRGREGFKAWSEVAPKFVKALKKKKFRYMTSAILRQTLQVAAFAEETFPKVDQENWDGLIDMIAKDAVKKGHDASTIIKWKESRYEAEIDLGEDFELDDLFADDAGEPDEPDTDPADPDSEAETEENTGGDLAMAAAAIATVAATKSAIPGTAPAA